MFNLVRDDITDDMESVTWGRTNYSNYMFACGRAGPDPPHGYSDSSDILKIILQMVQNQDRVVKDLYTHLRYGNFSNSRSCKVRLVCSPAAVFISRCLWLLQYNSGV